MVEVIPDMPPDTLGFRVSGRLARSDYVDEPVPPLQEGLEAGQRLRVPYAHLESAAMGEDLKLDVDLGIKHRDAWERIAVVTDLNWLGGAFALLMMGEKK